MRIDLIAVGRMKPGPELDLFDLYRSRFDATGRSVSLGPLSLAEVEEKRRLKRTELAAREAEKIRSALTPGTKLIALDETGRSFSSQTFAGRLAAWRDEGAPSATFVIGGAGGLDNSLLSQADLKLSFGVQTWPHMLARVMLCEQLYRAATILAGHPYHREG
jgi:23S rRNA (pseudouridine1915-N3)-methyltransferase